MKKVLITIFLTIIVSASFSARANVVADNNLSEQGCCVLEKHISQNDSSLVLVHFSGENNQINHTADNYSNCGFELGYSGNTSFASCNGDACGTTSSCSTTCLSSGVFASILPTSIRYNFNEMLQSPDQLQESSYRSILIPPVLRPPII